ncbi:MAG: translocation/assembly module TamB, partial [Vicinamibacterales bacterium]|nr:translocation/assembly module TamB [Vicinamibacterales bacterium]
MGTGRLSLAEARYGDIRPGAIDVTAEAGGDGSALLRGVGQELGVQAEAVTRLAAPHAYDATISATDFDLARLGDVGLLDEDARQQVSGVATARVEATGTLDDLGQSILLVHLDAYRGSVYGLPLELVEPARLRASSTELSSEGIAIRTGATTARAHGTLTRADEGRFALDVDGRLSDLLPLWQRLTGRGVIANGTLTASIAAVGPIDSPRLTGVFAASGVRAQADEAPGLTEFSLDAAIEDGRVILRRANGQLGEATFAVEGSAPLRLLEGRLPARVLRANPSSGDATLKADFRNLTVATLGRLAGSPPGDDLSGAFDVHAELAATSTSLRDVTGTVLVERGTFTTNTISLRQVGRATLEVRDSVARFEEWRWAGGRSDVALRGQVAFGRTPVGFDIEARGPIDLATLGPVMPGRTAGTLRLDVRATREGERARVHGELVVTGGTWIEREMQVALTEVGGTVSLRGDRAVFEGITGRLNGGDVTVTGALGRSPDGRAFTGALGVTGRGVTLEFPPRVVNDVDADLQLTAPGPRATSLGITGSAKVRPGALRASLRELASMFAPEATVAPTAEAERRQRLLSAVGLDIAIETTDDLVANSNDLRAQMGASVRLTGTLAQPGMTGRAEIREDGELFLAGRPYRLRGGHIEFADPSRIAPSLSLLGDTRVSDYEVEMQLTGPVERLELRLRSNPPLSQADLASLLTTGQTLRERRENAEQAEEAARAQLLSLVSSEYLGRIGSFFGFDTVRIE